MDRHPRPAYPPPLRSLPSWWPRRFGPALVAPAMRWGADHPDWGLVVANPKFVTLAADVEQTVTLDNNYAQVEVALVANAAPTYFNTSDTAIGTVSGTMDGNHAVSSILVAKIVQDGTSGQATIVHLRSSGIPTVSVCGL